MSSHPARARPEAPFRDLPVEDATAESVHAHGTFLGADVVHAGLPIPYYAGTVIEGHALDFAYRGRAVVRTARIHRRPDEVLWLERHLDMTQLFVGLGADPFLMVLGAPTHAAGSSLPDLATVRAFRFPAGHGILLHRGTWHDFPMAWTDAVTVLTASSEEVIDALASARSAEELTAGDVRKIDVPRRLGARLRVARPGGR